MKKKVFNYKTILVTMMIGFVLFYIAFDFRMKLDYELDKQAIARLSRRADAIANVINSEFKGQFAIFDSLAQMIADNHHDNEQIATILDSFNDNITSHYLSYTNTSGDSISADGTQFNISDRTYFQETIDNGFSIAFIEKSYVDQEEKIILSKAIYTESGEFSGMISSIYDDKSFYDLFSSLEYEKYVLISDKNGQVMININMYDDKLAIENVFDFYEATKSYDDETFTKVALDVKAGLSDIVAIGKGEDRYYISYFYVDQTDWVVFTAVPYMMIWSQFDAISDISISLLVQVSLVFMIIVLLVYFFEHRKREEINTERELLQRSEARYRVLDTLTQSILIEGDFTSDTITFSSNQETILGHIPTTRKISDYLNENPYVYHEDLVKMQKFIEDLKKGTNFTSIDCRFIAKDNTCIWSRITGISLKDGNNEVIGFIARVTNSDEQIKQINTLIDAARRDSLTKITNRNAIEAQVNEYVLSRSGKEEISAFFVIDMDNFKDVNDKQGHLIGDKLLIGIADTMRKMFRRSDFVGRLGGDEFAVFMCDVPNVKTVTDKAIELLRDVNEITKVYNNDGRLSCSIGIAITHDNKELFEQLYIRADRALYRSKTKGKNQYMIDIVHKEGK